MPGIAGAGKFAAMKAMAAKGNPKGKKPKAEPKDDMGALAAFAGKKKKKGRSSY